MQYMDSPYLLRVCNTVYSAESTDGLRIENESESKGFGHSPRILRELVDELWHIDGDEYGISAKTKGSKSENESKLNRKTNRGTNRMNQIAPK